LLTLEAICVVPSMHEVCLKLGLLDQYHLAMEEAIVSNSPAHICTLFAVILAWCEPSIDIYDEALAEDFLHQLCILERDEHIQLSTK